ncbi:GNAT family N-acetyltransferase [Patescibacteria group bacterium]|nr:GNAT family N-acetyltransferase [Patescibacteria group bacterium]
MKVIHRGKTKTGKDLIIRYPQPKDLLSVWRYFNQLSAEKTFITFQGEKISKKTEADWLDKNIKNIRQKKCVFLFVFIDGKLSGISDITLKERVSKHIGSFGITLSPEARGQGVGKLLMKLVISESKKRLPGLKIIILGCFANNEVALNLYKSLGFTEYGRLPKALFRKNTYVDEVLMHQTIE